MSYLRGNTYIWSDSDRTHFWAFDGADEWEESVWAAGLGDSPGNRAGPAGVAIAQPVIDAFVVMRFAELVDEGALQSAIGAALDVGYGSGGCVALQNLAIRLRNAFPTEDQRASMESA